MHPIKYLRRLRWHCRMAPFYCQQYFLNCTEYGFRAIDLVFSTNLYERFSSARMKTVGHEILYKKPFTVRTVWKNFKSAPRSTMSQRTNH